MDLAEPLAKPWLARLDLGFERRDAASILSRRSHFGPLRVQKALYPEGESVCHALPLHPPSGIAGGDQLEIAVEVGSDAHALLTTPGAGKWYRTHGPRAGQALDFRVGENAALEWLPQESIVFNAARADMRASIRLASGARFIGWEILCLGRRASGEAFSAGDLTLNTRIEREGRLIWLERGALEGGGPLLDSPVGLAGYSVSATLLASAPGLDAGLLAACRAAPAREGRQGVTLLPDLLVARYLGHASESARQWLAAVWAVLRPALLGRQAIPPRIWNT
jgi:urease accessory protein